MLVWGSSWQKVYNGLHQCLQVGVVVIQHLRTRLGVGDKLQLAVAVGGKERGFDLRDGFRSVRPAGVPSVASSEVSVSSESRMG